MWVSAHHLPLPRLLCTSRKRMGLRATVCPGTVYVYVFPDTAGCCPCCILSLLLADARPQYLKDFASQLEKLQTLAQDAKRTVRLNNIVEEMFKTLAQSNVRISSEDSVQLDDMRNAQMVRALT